MKPIKRIQARLKKDRPMLTISMRLPDDVVDELKRLAPLLGFSGYQPLIRAYIGKGIREDLKKMRADKLPTIVAGLRRRGVKAKVIAEAVAEANANT